MAPPVAAPPPRALESHAGRPADPPHAPARSRAPRIAAIATLLAAVALVGVVVLTWAGDEAPSPVATAVATPTATATVTPTPVPTVAPAGVRRISSGGVTYSVPSTGGWALSAPQQRGALTVRRLTGPDGELIRIVHSPGVRAEPVASTVVSEQAFAAPSVTDAGKFVLEHFPSDRCVQRRCDDYVLNDDSFGGLAILAGDSGGPASRVAAKIARTVTAR